ncbi:hypothetical protein HYY70_04675 [Candidatus Woesearchaeota archaeon]|nr:hypothetical protein [Candidatus Woesearchaeota archaeon]
MKNNKGYYLILDSLISIIIFLIGSLLISSYFSNKPDQTIAKPYVDDSLNLLNSVKISDLCDLSDCECSDRNLRDLCRNSKIKNYNNTIIELIGELHSTNEFDKIGPLIESMVIENKIVPNEFGFVFILNANDDYQYFPSSVDSQLEASPLVLQSKKVIFGYWEDDVGNLNYWGPYLAEAILWQK